MFTHRFILSLILLCWAPIGMACSYAPSDTQILLLMKWIEEHRPRTKALTGIPSVVKYNTVSRIERSAQCGEMCDHADGKYDLNFYFPKTNRIALVQNAREDQLIHELVHAYQYAEDAHTDGTDDSLEDEAVYYQQMYQKEFGLKEILWALKNRFQ